jgi:hypothetical protein
MALITFKSWSSCRLKLFYRFKSFDFKFKFYKTVFQNTNYYIYKNVSNKKIILILILKWLVSFLFKQLFFLYDCIFNLLLLAFIILQEFLPPSLNHPTFLDSVLSPFNSVLQGLPNLFLRPTHLFQGRPRGLLSSFQFSTTLVTASILRCITCPIHFILWLIRNTLILTIFNFFFNSWLNFLRH